MNATTATSSQSAPRTRPSTTRPSLATILRNAAPPTRVSFGASTAAENPMTHAGTNLRELRDERLKSVRSLIESQLPTVKGTIETIAVTMIDATKVVRNFEARLVGWNEATTEKPYIPRSARVTCPLTYSESLADDTETLRLKRELEDTVQLFAVNASFSMKQMAQREIEYAKETKTKKFAELSVKLFEYVTLHIIENEKLGESAQYEKDFKTFGIVILLHFLKTKVPDRMFGTYLPRREMVYTAICKELFENMRDHDHQLQRPDPALTDDENIIRRAVEKSINTFFMKVTYDLQMDLDEATEAKQHEATLAAYVKKSTIQAATSATQTALDQQQALQGHPSLANNMDTLMEEKISRLMDKQLSDRIPKHITKVMKSWGRKNSSGGRHQPPVKPNGNTSDGPGSKKQPPTANQHAKRKQAKSTDPTGKPNESGKRNNQQRRNKSPSKAKANSKEKQHSPGRNGNDSPGGKRKGGYDGNNGKRKKPRQKR